MTKLEEMRLLEEIYREIVIELEATERLLGKGPVYTKTGGKVNYRKEDLDAWIEKGFKND